MKKKWMKKILSLALTAGMVLSMIPATAFLGGSVHAADPCSSDYFYNQLNERAQAIYDELYSRFTGSEKSEYQKGTKLIDLTEIQSITDDDVTAYMEGNKSLYNDFTAAKDALDLDHSELWWLDSGYLTFRASKDENGNYHVIIGPGRGDTYLLAGKSQEEIVEAGSGSSIESMDDAADKAIDKIVDEAYEALNDNEASKGFSDADRDAFIVGKIHDAVTKGIHYRYEIQCRDNGKAAPFIRTVYGFVTHEGVCEAYSRTLQVALIRAGIKCVLVHGVQTKGTPEDHMWNAVQIDSKWYVVDATWDDPLVAKFDGSQDLSFKNGDDGNETNTYLLVGQNLVGEYWRPSGIVSTGAFEFSYPDIEDTSYNGSTMYEDNGIVVKYSAGGIQEDVPAGVFAVTYKKMDSQTASAKGLYFLLKMYDYHLDGTADVMEDWYYVDATLAAIGNLNGENTNPYIGDYDGTLRISSATCEYIEIAVTTRKPEGRETWGLMGDPANALMNNPSVGFFQGEDSEIVAQTGMLLNVNAGYEAPPYVLTQTPAPNGNVTAGSLHHFKVTYDDYLYHILPTDEDAHEGIMAADQFQDDYAAAKSQKVQLRYTTDQEDLHAGNGTAKAHVVAGELNFDKNRDGIVDNVTWIYAYEPDECPNKAYHKKHPDKCDVEKGCPLSGVEFDFKASDLWIDDLTKYSFTIEGVVGSRSNKFPNDFSAIARITGRCATCYRSEGIDWNVWGQPTLLDAPEDLDFTEMAKAGGTDLNILEKFDDLIHKDNINGRLMLVVEDQSKGVGNRQEYEKINGALEEKKGFDSKDVISSNVFEINFNRICPAIKLKPNAGQSVRVQVGYPAGVTYESLGSGEQVIKGYHFTRCGGEDLCKEYLAEIDGVTDPRAIDAIKAAHKWGEHIISVEEIDITPTPYGLVVVCNAFSPFEIVALKGDEASKDAAKKAERQVIVASDGNGYVTANGKKATGEDGIVKAGEDGTLTFSVTANEGYVVDTVAFGGDSDCVEKTGENTYKISGIDKNDVLKVTFIPETVKDEQEKEDLGETVVAKVCPHTELTEGKVKEEKATCTKNGRTGEMVCKECGEIVQASTVISATGHINTHEEKAAKAADCTNGGNTAKIICDDCKQTISDFSEIQPLGHYFGKYEDTGKEPTCQGTEKMAKCERPGCKATDTIYDKTRTADHKFTKYVHETDSTCTTPGTEKATCDTPGCNEADIRTDKADPAKGHKPSESGNGICKVCDKLICRDGKHEGKKVIPKHDATCTEPGTGEGWECTVCGMKETGETIPAKGHTFPNGEHTKGSKCVVCGYQLTQDKHEEEPIPKVEPTCTEDGSQNGTRCRLCKEVIKQPEKIDRLGHDWDEKSAKWHWSEEDGVSAAVTLKCKREGCGHEQAFEAEEEYTVIKEAGCTDPGTGTYTAKVTVNGKTYTDTYKGELPVPATGHKYDKAKPKSEAPATCIHKATKTYECSVCGEEIVIEDPESGYTGHKPSGDVIFVPATCTEGGRQTYTCAVCHQTIDEETPATGHKYENGRCVTCGAADSNYKQGWVDLPKGTDSGVTAKIPESEAGSYENVQLFAEEINEKDEKHAADIKAVSSKYKEYEIFDISLIDTVTKQSVQPKTSLTISIPVPKGWEAARTLVYHVDGDKMEAVNVTATQDGLFVTFTVDHLSVYALVNAATEIQPQGTAQGTPTQGANSSPATGDKANIVLWSVLTVLGGCVAAAALIIQRKKH